jgi:hypothetical protein
MQRVRDICPDGLPVTAHGHEISGFRGHVFVIDIEGGRKIDQPGESLKEGRRRKKTRGIRAEVLGQGMALIDGVHRAVYY